MASDKIAVANLQQATLFAVETVDRYGKNKLRLPRNFFLNTHGLLLRHKPKYAGRFRKETDKIQVGKKTFTIVPAWQVEMKVNDFIDEVNNPRKFPSRYRKYILKRAENLVNFGIRQREIVYSIFIAWYAHHKFVAIHPYCDGNGRMARLLMCLILRDRGLSRASYPVLVNNIISQDKKRYLDALNAADHGDYIFGINYFSEILAAAYRATTKQLEEQARQLKLF